MIKMFGRSCRLVHLRSSVRTILRITSSGTDLLFLHAVTTMYNQMLLSELCRSGEILRLSTPVNLAGQAPESE